MPRGRPKGSQNKVTTTLKEAILKAAEEAGGQEGLVGYLRKQAKQNPGPFMQILGKVLPATMQSEVKVIHEAIEREIIRPPKRDHDYVGESKATH